MVPVFSSSSTFLELKLLQVEVRGSEKTHDIIYLTTFKASHVNNIPGNTQNWALETRLQWQNSRCERIIVVILS